MSLIMNRFAKWIRRLRLYTALNIGLSFYPDFIPPVSVYVIRVHIKSQANLHFSIKIWLILFFNKYKIEYK